MRSDAGKTTNRMAKRPDIPKRLAARIRGAQERVRQKRYSIVASETNYAQSSKRVAEFEADPIDFANRHYRGQGHDSYPVQTTISRERERIAYHERRHVDRLRELAELELQLQQVEAEVLVEVSAMRLTSGRVPWPRRLPTFTKFRVEFEEQLRREEERWRVEKEADDAEFEALIAMESAAFEAQSRLEDEQIRRELAAMTPQEYAEYRAWADYFTRGLKDGSLKIGDVIGMIQAGSKRSGATK